MRPVAVARQQLCPLCPNVGRQLFPAPAPGPSRLLDLLVRPAPSRRCTSSSSTRVPLQRRFYTERTATPSRGEPRAGAPASRPNRILSQSRSHSASGILAAASSPTSAPLPSRGGAAAAAAASSQEQDLPSLDRVLEIVESTRQRFLSINGIPTPELSLVALNTCLRAARSVNPYVVRHSGSLRQDMAASHGRPDANTAQGRVRAAVDAIADAADTVIHHPPVVITPQLLELYVDVCLLLRKADSLPHVFGMFASKAVPRTKGSRLWYVPQNPNRAEAAIEADIVTKALDTAIASRDLGAAVALTKACYATTAFKRQKIMRHAAVPTALVCITPPLAYGLASTLAQLQWVADIGTATGIAFTALMAYAGVTGGLGVLARLSDMDHMKRITWLGGTPMWDRWMREEERAALDKIAGAWGFREDPRHGEEGGHEWEAFRQYVYLRGMILDRLEFMEGIGS